MSNYKAYVVKSNRSLFGKLIRLFSRGEWDHVMLANGKNVIEMQTDGLKMWSFAGYARVNTIAQLKLPSIEEGKVLEWYSLNVDRKYDWLRTLLWPFRSFIKSGSKKRDNCIEMVRAVYVHAGKVAYPRKNYSPDEVAKLVGIKL